MTKIILLKNLSNNQDAQKLIKALEYSDIEFEIDFTAQIIKLQADADIYRKAINIIQEMGYQVL